MNTIEVTIQANPYQQEELIALLNDYEPLGYEEKDESLHAYFDEQQFEENVVRKIIEGYEFEIKSVGERNWNAEWEKSFEPVIVDDFVAVRADFHPSIKNVHHEIIITPKMSFGTGHHATTFMMISQMRDMNFDEKNVFDFGTGTGILSILAEKLGASRVVAIDVDSWSIENAGENLQRNSCSRVVLKQASDLPAESFDIVLANINRNVILEYLKGLKSILKNDGEILFSGLLKNDEPDIKNACEQEGLQLVNMQEKDNWISLRFINKNDNDLN